jgi:4-amino-4-deoxy-L-arabinose transferase-like glycosyltransferase
VTRSAADRRPWIGIAAVTVLALAVRALGLADQPLIADDELAGLTARNFVGFGWPGPTMWHHPRLRDLLVHLSTGALGQGAWGLKLWSVLLGTLTVPGTAWMVRLAGAGWPAALLSAAIVAIDPLHAGFSRQAINDVYVAFFPVAAIVALLLYAERRRPWQLVAAGAFLGLGLASKWSAIFPVGAAALLTLPRVVASLRSRAERLAELAFAGAALGLLPAAVYLLTFWPWFGRGHDLGAFVRFQAAMGAEATTHTGMAGTMVAGFTGYLVGAWRWFVQPVWWVDAIGPGTAQAGVPAGGLLLPAVGNPVTWLATLPAAAWAGLRWLRERDRTAGFLLAVWLAAYLPFVLVPRPVFANSAVVVVPFWAALVGLAAARLGERARGPVATWAAVAVVTAFLLWLPATGQRFAPSDALVRVLVPPVGLDLANHPATSISGVDAGR